MRVGACMSLVPAGRASLKIQCLVLIQQLHMDQAPAECLGDTGSELRHSATLKHPACGWTGAACQRNKPTGFSGLCVPSNTQFCQAIACWRAAACLVMYFSEPGTLQQAQLQCNLSLCEAAHNGNLRPMPSTGRPSALLPAGPAWGLCPHAASASLL